MGIINPNNKPGYKTLSVPSTLPASQADMYKSAITSFIKNLPAAQHAGITVWGVNDKNSWPDNAGIENHLLFDNNYNSKPAYTGVLQGLRVQQAAFKPSSSCGLQEGCFDHPSFFYLFNLNSDVIRN